MMVPQDRVARGSQSLARLLTRATARRGLGEGTDGHRGVHVIAASMPTDTLDDPRGGLETDAATQQGKAR
jgi:hypothetical protein